MKKYFLLTAIVLAAMKISLMQAIPVTAVGYNVHDDVLFLRQAGGLGLWLNQLIGQKAPLAQLGIQLYDGWLGQYDELILSKGPFYCIWIAFCLLAGIPLLTAQHVLYAGAGFVVVSGLRRELSSNILLLLLFTYFLFNPEFVSRVVRSGIYPALSVIVLGGLFGIYSSRYENWRQIGVWSLLVSIFLPFFWLTREEGIWLAPTILLILGATIIAVYRRHGLNYNFLIKAFLTGMPFFFLYGSLQWISSMNDHYYGTQCVVELKSEAFQNGYGSLLRVKGPVEPYVVVPNSVREKIYDVSPTFKELKPFLEGEQGQMWKRISCEAYPEICGEIGSGWFLWAFRDAVALAGHHTNGQEAERYYRQLADEIDTACSDGKLQCSPKRKTLMPPLTFEDGLKIIRNIPRGLLYLLRFENLLERLNQPFYSIGSDKALSYFQQMTNETIAPSIESTGTSSFSQPIPTMLNGFRMKILTKIAGYYRTTTPYLFATALLFYLLSLVNSLIKRHIRPLTLFSTALLVAIFSRLTLLSLIDTTSFQGYNHYYMSPLYSFLLLFILLAFIDFFQAFRQKSQKRKYSAF